MSFVSILLVVAGILVGVSLVALFSSLKIKNLRTVPAPLVLDSEAIKIFPAETRAGLRLHQACYANDPKAASEALTMWAWAKGEAAVANSLGKKTDNLISPGLRLAITELWVHLDPENKDQWFGHNLWTAFLHSYPEFQEMEFTG